jgi:hypothetical protein
MEVLNWLKENAHIDGIIVLIVVAAGLFQKTFLGGFAWVKDEKYDGALKTLLVSAIVVGIKLYFEKVRGSDIWDAFLSYFLATSFYELFARPIVKFIRRKIVSLTGDDGNN